MFTSKEFNRLAAAAKKQFPETKDIFSSMVAYDVRANGALTRRIPEDPSEIQKVFQRLVEIAETKNHYPFVLLFHCISKTYKKIIRQYTHLSKPFLKTCLHSPTQSKQLESLFWIVYLMSNYIAAAYLKRKHSTQTLPGQTILALFQKWAKTPKNSLFFYFSNQCLDQLYSKPELTHQLNLHLISLEKSTTTDSHSVLISLKKILAIALGEKFQLSKDPDHIPKLFPVKLNALKACLEKFFQIFKMLKHPSQVIKLQNLIRLACPAPSQLIQIKKDLEEFQLGESILEGKNRIPEHEEVITSILFLMKKLANLHPIKPTPF